MTDDFRCPVADYTYFSTANIPLIIGEAAAAKPAAAYIVLARKRDESPLTRGILSVFDTLLLDKRMFVADRVK